MEKRPRFDLRPALALWSAILGIFSIFGAIRTIPELAYVIHNYGFEFSVNIDFILRFYWGFYTANYDVMDWDGGRHIRGQAKSDSAKRGVFPGKALKDLKGLQPLEHQQSLVLLVLYLKG